ncbi:hypothetical protein Nepgr_019565 [Nepenthes gracilis]|uniref:Uncharacterized protein n=1 Tax=Nepenthes gracilis TaxID=150966 RepID=A0AAD3SVH3_NEPGR|nr:hypothetical protein Nepgr_019565 [Nepenthes gracilis]
MLELDVLLLCGDFVWLLEILLVLGLGLRCHCLVFCYGGLGWVVCECGNLWCCVLLRDAESDWSIAADAVMIYPWANALLYGTSEARVVDWR